MSESIINYSYTLKKIHPIIIKKDKYSLCNFTKGKEINNINKIYLKNSMDSNNNNLKALINPNLEKINEFRKSLWLNENENEIKKNNKNYNLYTINNMNYPKLNNNFFKSNNINNIKYRKNRSTNISKELNRIKNNKIEINEEKIFYINNNEIINFKLYKSNKNIFENNNIPFKSFYCSNNRDINTKIMNRNNFIKNIKASNFKISSKEKHNILYNKTLNNNNNNLKKLSFKKIRRMQSLKENIIWNEYTKMEKDKKNQRLKKKQKMKEEILNLIKLFKNSYSFKKYKNKENMNKKEKYLNFIEDHSLALRENIIKNNLQENRGGKQNLRKIYNPFNV